MTAAAIVERNRRAAASRARMKRARGPHPCSGCGGAREGNDAYCRRCRADYLRTWRKNQREISREKQTAGLLAGLVS